MYKAKYNWTLQPPIVEGELISVKWTTEVNGKPYYIITKPFNFSFLIQEGEEVIDRARMLQ